VVKGGINRLGHNKMVMDNYDDWFFLTGSKKQRLRGQENRDSKGQGKVMKLSLGQGSYE